jgi:FkbM family methyltransferase
VREVFYRILYHPFINRIVRNLNKFLAPLLPARLQVPPSGIITVHLRTSSFQFSTNQTNTTSQLLFWRGPYEIEYTVIFEDLIRKINCFYDVGAHAGYYSLIAASVNPAVKVVAFEPASGPFHYLEKNIRINGFTGRIHATPVALGNVAGTAEFLEVIHSKYSYLQHNLVAVGNLSHEQPNRTMKKLPVTVTTLDLFTKNHPQPDLIKLDTEGTEHFILMGGAATLKSHPIVIAETLFDTIEGELEDLMRPLGYNFFNYKDGKLHRVSSIRRKSDNGVHDCFFVHPDHEHLIAPYLNPHLAIQ